jgi:hypothetical protein
MRLVRCITVMLMVTASSPGQAADPANPNDQDAQRRRAMAMLQALMPLPADAPREIRNPYHARPAWKLWAKDETPVKIDRPHFKAALESPQPVHRRYPYFPETWTTGAPPVESNLNPVVAGSWDDVYLSLDNFHTRLRQPKDQFILAGKMAHGADWKTRFELGVNFTSQSYAQRGRHIVDDTLNNLNTERHFFFANCVRATPAHASYRDVDPTRTTDLYDGLFGHSFQSVGQSGSEMHAIYKMMIAGSCLSRELKDKLKHHGLYAPALLTLFKAALPYTDARGEALPYENELRHRPAYSAHGTPQHPHYCSANIAYHGYDDDAHLRRMVEMARQMTVAPPVALMDITGLGIIENGQTIGGNEAAQRCLKSFSLTQVRVWGEAGQTLIIQVDLTRSYDLGDSELTFTGRAVYPNHTNVKIQQTKPGVFQVTVTPRAELPKGRIPIIFVARNAGPVPSNPVFLNVYYGEDGELADYGVGRDAPGKKLPVNNNQRPRLTIDLPSDTLRCAPGSVAGFQINAADPEGLPVTLYRRAGDVGQIEGEQFRWPVPADAEPGVHEINIIASDGTGSYAGKRVKLLISPGRDTLADGWHATLLGQTDSIGTVNSNGRQFAFRGMKYNDKQRGDEPPGYFAFTKADQPIDIAIRLPTDAEASAGLMVRNRMGEFSRRAWVGRLGDQVRCLVKVTQNNWGTQIFRAPAGNATHLRLIQRDGMVAGYLSADGMRWQQVGASPLKLDDEPHAGLFSAGHAQNAALPVRFRWVEPTGPALPMLTTGKSRPNPSRRHLHHAGRADGPPRRGRRDRSLHARRQAAHPRQPPLRRADHPHPTGPAHRAGGDLRRRQAGRHGQRGLHAGRGEEEVRPTAVGFRPYLPWSWSLLAPPKFVPSAIVSIQGAITRT